MAQEPFYSLGKNILGNKKITALDIGGATGLQPHWGKLEGNVRCVMFEPHDQSYNELVQIYQHSPHRDDFILINKALSGSGGMRTFYKTNCPTGSSILEPNTENPRVNVNNSYFFPIQTVPIETVTLKQVLDEAEIENVDMMKLDIQGAELEVIRGLGTRLARCLLIESEVSIGNFYKGSTSYCDIEKFLVENEFELLDLRCSRAPRMVETSTNAESYNEKYFNVKNTSPSIANRLYEFDALYVRNPMKLIERRDEPALRKLVYCYCIYNFFTEAVYTLELGLTHGIWDQQTVEQLGGQIAGWHNAIKESLSSFEQTMEKNKNLIWAQYVWSPYPSF